MLEDADSRWEIIAAFVEEDGVNAGLELRLDGK